MLNFLLFHSMFSDYFIGLTIESIVQRFEVFSDKVDCFKPILDVNIKTTDMKNQYTKLTQFDLWVFNDNGN